MCCFCANICSKHRRIDTAISCLYKILLFVGDVCNQPSSAVVSSVLGATAGLRILASLSFDRDPKSRKKSKRILNAQ